MSEKALIHADILGRIPIKDYIEIIRYRKWWIILAAIAVTIPVVVVAWHLPNTYAAVATVVLEQQVPNGVVPNPANNPLEEEFREIQWQVLSNNNLHELITAMNLYPDRRWMSDDELAQHLRKNISLQQVVQSGGTINAFRLTFRGKDPEVVAKVTNTLASMFVKEHSREREDTTSNTADFLSSELERTKQELERKEAELGAMKSQHVSDLPESKQFHLQTVESLRAQQRESADRVRAAQQQKVYLQSMLSNYAPTVDLDTSSSGAGSAYQSQIQKLEAQLGQLQSRYGPQHPDVRKVRKELEELKKKDAAEQADRPTVTEVAPHTPRTAHNPVLESQLAKLDEEIKAETKTQQELQPQIDFHTKKLEQIPLFEQKYTEMTRDYDILRNHYMSLLDKKLTVDTANQMNNGKNASRLRIEEPARTPRGPVGPNRPFFCFAGLIMGLIGGVGLAAVREMIDPSVRTAPEASEIAKVPVLGSVPPILSPRDIRIRRLWASLAVSGTVMGALAIGFVASSVAVRFF